MSATIQCWLILPSQKMNPLEGNATILCRTRAGSGLLLSSRLGHIQRRMQPYNPGFNAVYIRDRLWAHTFLLIYPLGHQRDIATFTSRRKCSSDQDLFKASKSIPEA